MTTGREKSRPVAFSAERLSLAIRYQLIAVRLLLALR